MFGKTSNRYIPWKSTENFALVPMQSDHCPIVQPNMAWNYSALFIMKIKEYLMTMPVKNKYLNALKFIALIGCDKFFMWIIRYISMYYNLRIKHKMPAIIEYKHNVTFECDVTSMIDKKLIHIIRYLFKATSKQLEDLIIIEQGQREKLNISEYGIDFLYNNICYYITTQGKKYVIKCSSNVLNASEIAEQTYHLLESEGKKTTTRYIKTISDDGTYHFIRPIKKSLNNIYLQKDISKTVTNFLNNYDIVKNKYHDMNMTYKTVFIVHGCPGTGKTSLAETVASELGRELALVNLREITNINSLQNILQSCSNDVIVFEEIDWILCEMNEITNFNSQLESSMLAPQNKLFPFERQKIFPQRITINDLLETLDGLRSVNDSVFFLTTNHIDKVDPALKRHGRIDYLLEIKLCDIEQFKKIFSDVLGKELNEEEINQFSEFKYSTSLIINSLVRNITEIKNMDFSEILNLFEMEYQKYQKISEK